MGEKYETTAGMIALLQYGSGVPFNRLQGLEKDLGIPLPWRRNGRWWRKPRSCSNPCCKN